MTVSITFSKETGCAGDEEVLGAEELRDPNPAGVILSDVVVEPASPESPPSPFTAGKDDDGGGRLDEPVADDEQHARAPPLPCRLDSNDGGDGKSRPPLPCWCPRRPPAKRTARERFTHELPMAANKEVQVRARCAEGRERGASSDTPGPRSQQGRWVCGVQDDGAAATSFLPGSKRIETNAKQAKPERSQ